MRSPLLRLLATLVIGCTILGSTAAETRRKDSTGKALLNVKLISSPSSAGTPWGEHSETRTRYPHQSRSRNTWNLPVPSPWQRMINSMRVHTGGPGLDASQVRDDLDPQNLQVLNKEMRDPRSQGPSQQQILRREKQRLEQVQAQQMQQAAQMFQQRLEQRLNPRIGTPQDTNPQAAQAAFMARLMAQMQRRHGVNGPTP